MLKWRRHKCGGSQPEGLDRIDSLVMPPARRTHSMKANIQPSSPRGVNRKNNDLFTRSCSEILDRKLIKRFNSSLNENNETGLGCKKRDLPFLKLDSPTSSRVDSPYISAQLDEIYKGFEKASLSAPTSPISDEEVHLVIPPKPCRQTSSGSLRRNSPTNLPCIEEAAENDELLSIADSGICDDEYDHKKHYFEPLKFHDDSECNNENKLDSDSPLLTQYHELNNSNSCSNNSSRHSSSSSTNSQISSSRGYRLESELTSSQESLDNISFAAAMINNNNKNDRQTSSPYNKLKLKADCQDSPSLPRRDQDKLHNSLMSSMLWNGNTSNQLPSSTGIYTTVPPNRYGQRNKDLMSQLHSYQRSVSAPASPDRKSSPKEFKVSLDVSHYGPDEILVTLEDGKLVVNGKHFSESEYGFESLQFHRRYPIPEGIKKADIKSTITDEGVLVIIGRVVRVGTPELRVSADYDRLSEYDNVAPSPRLQRRISSGRTTPDEVLPSNEHKVISPSPSRRSLVTSDYSEDSRSRLSDDSRSYASSTSENEFHETDDNTYALAVNCKGYDPQDLEIKIQSRELIVHGRQKICSVENGNERIRHKEFTKRYSVPRNANCHQIMSRFTENEQLIVEITKSLGSSCKLGSKTRDILDAE